MPFLPAWPRGGGGGLARGRRGFLRYPCHVGPIVFESLRTLQSIFGGIHYEVPFVVVFSRCVDGVEGNRNILLTHSKKSADPDDERGRFAFTIDEDVHDLADLVIFRIVDVLLVPVGDRHAVSRHGRKNLSGWHGLPRRTLRGLGVCGCSCERKKQQRRS